MAGENLARFLDGVSIFVRLAPGQIHLLLAFRFYLFSLFSPCDEAHASGGNAWLLRRESYCGGFVCAGANMYMYLHALRVVHNGTYDDERGEKEDEEA